jgi:hypothetical protein
MQSSKEEIENLVSILDLITRFKKEWGYNPFDNYTWREVLTFDYLRKYFPTIERLKGRYGADGICPELEKVWIEQKSVIVVKRVKLNDYDWEKIYFEIDVSKNRDKHKNADTFLFPMFDVDSPAYPYPVEVLFISEPDNVQKVKDLIAAKIEVFNQEAVRKRDTIMLRYRELCDLSVIYRAPYEAPVYEPPSTLMEFLL